MSLRHLVLSLCLAVLAVPAQAQVVRQQPPSPAPEPVLFVPDEFIVVFRAESRAQLTARRDARGRIVASLPAVQRLVDRTAASEFRRQFANAVPRSAASRFPDLTGHYLVKLPPGRDLDQAMAEFAADPTVDHVEPIGIHLVSLTPNDTYYFNPPVSFPYYQWHYQKNSYGIDADLAWDDETGDPSVVVGVLDTGVKYRHSDLGGGNPPGPNDGVTQGNVFVNAAETPGNALDDDGNGFVDDVVGWDFVSAGGGPGVTCTDADCGGTDNDPNDGEGHGTHVAGTVSAITNNARAVAGVAGGFSNGTTGGAGNGVKVLPLRIGYRATVMGQTTGVVRMDWAAQAMNYVSGLVDDGVNVAAINCSWGSSNSGGIDAAVNDLLAHDVMIVSAAGNSGSSTSNYLGDKAGVMAVAATDSLGNPPSFTNRGAWVEIAAPGVDIMSTYHVPTDLDTTHMYVALLSGTSMSAPHVCGVAALLESYNPALTRPEKFSLMENNTNPYNGVLDLGSGIVNARLALDAAAPPCAIVADFSGTPLGPCTGVSVSFTDLSTGGPVSWSWDFGDGGSSTLQNPSHAYAAPGTYAVTLTASNGGCLDIESKTAYVTVGAAPVSEFSASTVSGEAPLNVDFTDLSSNGPTGWSWNFGDGGTATVQDPSYQYTTQGTYTVTLTATNACGSDPEVKTAYITVLGPVGVSGEVAGAASLRLAPAANPVREAATFRIRAPADGPVVLRIMDASGRLVRRLTADGAAGERTLVWDGRDDRGTPAGIGLYVATAQLGAASAMTKVVLVR